MRLDLHNATQRRWGPGPALCAVVATIASAACGPSTRHTGTYQAEPGFAPAPKPRLAHPQARGLVHAGDVSIIEGDAELVSTNGATLGLVLNESRNDPGAVTRRFATQIADTSALLVLFTTFDDRGSGGPAYFIPIANDVDGTGLGPIDQRADFGAERLQGLVNMKRFDSHGHALIPRMVHEIAHRHLAYMRARTRSSTITLDLTGRQQGHWHAALHTDGSLLEGYGWRESGPGRFVSIARSERLSTLDLYGLGLIEPDEVAPFFFIQNARTEQGAAIPPGAQLPLGTLLRGTRVDLTADDVINAIGRRPRGPALQHILLAVLTAPGESATSTRAMTAVDQVERLRPQIEQTWSTLTGGRGALCTRLDGCESPSIDAGPGDSGSADATGPAARESCDCSSRSANNQPSFLLWALFGFGLRRRLSGAR